jgi:hypothetical protein
MSPGTPAAGVVGHERDAPDQRVADLPAVTFRSEPVLVDGMVQHDDLPFVAVVPGAIDGTDARLRVRPAVA